MNLEEARKKIEDLSKTLEEHNHNYYVLDKPTISDFEFDKMLEELIALEREFPELLRSDSPSQRVGGGITKEFKTVFNMLCPDWRQRLLAVTTDGAAKMMGCYNGFATNIEHEVTHKLIQVWCSAHQLDLVVHHFYEKLNCFLFFPVLLNLINFTRWQQTFKKMVGSKCPQVCTTQWLSMSEATKWIKSKKQQINNLLYKKIRILNLILLFGLCCTPSMILHKNVPKCSKVYICPLCCLIHKRVFFVD